MFFEDVFLNSFQADFHFPDVSSIKTIEAICPNNSCLKAKNFTINWMDSKIMQSVSFVENTLRADPFFDNIFYEQSIRVRIFMTSSVKVVMNVTYLTLFLSQKSIFCMSNKVLEQIW